MTKRANLAAPKLATKVGTTIEVRPTRAEFFGRYRRALEAYLTHEDDGRLRVASELGGAALRGGLGVFDLSRLHEEALVTMATESADGARSAGRTPAEEAFLLEALSPFAAARRGLPEAYQQLERLNNTLRRRDQALAESTGQQQVTEAALRASRARYLALFRQARSLKADVRQHSAQVILAQEEERKRVSRELHDEVGQVLAAVNIGLALLKKKAGSDRTFQAQVIATQGLLEHSMEAVHRFARELRPEMLELFGPYEAIRSYVRAVAERTGIAATISAKVDLGGLDSEQEIVLFRVAQESVTNISKHAQATRVEVSFRRLPQGVCMEIQDDGRAFSVAEHLNSVGVGRLGLRGMQERVRLVRGDFSIESEVGRGTTVRVQLPLAAAPDGNNHARAGVEPARAGGKNGRANLSL